MPLIFVTRFSLVFHTTFFTPGLARFSHRFSQRFSRKVFSQRFSHRFSQRFSQLFFQRFSHVLYTRFSRPAHEFFHGFFTRGFSRKAALHKFRSWGRVRAEGQGRGRGGTADKYAKYKIDHRSRPRWSSKVLVVALGQQNDYHARDRCELKTTSSNNTA